MLLWRPMSRRPRLDIDDTDRRWRQRRWQPGRRTAPKTTSRRAYRPMPSSTRQCSFRFSQRHEVDLSRRIGTDQRTHPSRWSTRSFGTQAPVQIPLPESRQDSGSSAVTPVANRPEQAERGSLPRAAVAPGWIRFPWQAYRGPRRSARIRPRRPASPGSPQAPQGEVATALCSGGLGPHKSSLISPARVARAGSGGAPGRPAMTARLAWPPTSAEGGGGQGQGPSARAGRAFRLQTRSGVSEASRAHCGDDRPISAASK